MSLSISVPSYALFITSVAVAVIVCLSVTYIYLPSATITIAPEIETKTVSQAINISAAVTSPDFVLFKLPAAIIASQATREKTFTRGGDATFDDFARGHVTLFNQQDTGQQLLPKTHLRHEATGIFFLTDTGISIPPRGKIGLAVTAKEKGRAGNVMPGKFIIDKLAPSLQSRIFGESTQEFSGGLAVSTPISDEEVNRSKSELFTEIKEQLLGDLTSQVSGAPINPDLVDFRETESSLSVPIGSRASEFRLSLAVKGQAFIVDENDLLSLTLLKLRSLSGTEQEFLEYAPQSFKFTLIKRDFDHQEALVEGSLSGTFASKIAPTAFSANNLAGLSAKEVEEFFKPIPGIGQVTVKTSPFWVKSIPGRKEAVKIVVDSK